MRAILARVLAALRAWRDARRKRALDPWALGTIRLEREHFLRVREWV